MREIGVEKQHIGELELDIPALLFTNSPAKIISGR
jgi:hypothetical protein